MATSLVRYVAVLAVWLCAATAEYAICATARETRSVERLIAALNDPSPEKRTNAVVALGDLKDPRAVGPLIAALKDPDLIVRRTSAMVLGEIQDPRAVGPLIAAMKNLGPEAWVAGDALGEIRDASAVEPLVANLKSPDPDVRRGAAMALGSIRDRRAIEPLISALKDPNTTVRQSAAVGLGNIPDARSVEPLIAALKDSDSSVRHSSAIALGEIDNRHSVEPLIARLKDPDGFVKWSAAKALGSLKDSRAILPLIDTLCDSTWGLSQFVSEALREIGNSAIPPLLAALARTDPKVRCGATSVLGLIEVSSSEEARVTDALIRSLNDADSCVQKTASWSLINNKSLHAIQPLITALASHKPKIREFAARELGKQQNISAIEALTAALRDTDQSVRLEAADSLAEIRKARLNGPPLSSQLDFKVISNIDLTAPFRAKTKWTFMIYQKPDTCDPNTSEECAGPFEFCFMHNGSRDCSQITGEILDDAKIVVPKNLPRHPLLVTETHPDNEGPGSSDETTKVWGYNAQSNTFPAVFEQSSYGNTNEETRIIMYGPLSGDIVVSTAPERAPYHYGIVVYRPTKSGPFIKVLRFTGGTVYGDGNRLAVIDSEMFETEQRLHVWKPGDPLPTPPHCPTVKLHHDVEWCE